MKQLPLIGILCLLFANLLTAQQSRLKLQAEKKKLEEEIAYTNQLLNATGKNKKTTMNELILVSKKLEKTTYLISNINIQLQETQQELLQAMNDIEQLDLDLKVLKDEYNQLLVFMYRNRNTYNRLMFIFSAEDFNQAYRRLRYLDQYQDFIVRKARQIEELTIEKSLEIDRLKGIQKDKQKLLDEQQSNRLKLDRERAERDLQIAALSKQENKLRSDIKSKQNAARKLQESIEAIIAEEIRKAREQKDIDGSSPKENLLSFTPEQKQLSDDFALNRGKLPWPSERGLISSSFGEHAHPVLKGVKVKNNGVDILTEEGAEARAVFGGMVISIKRITNTNIAVILRHGEYFTVYSNLDLVNISRGQQIIIKEKIGRVHTDSDGQTELHFEIWKGRELQDPANWLAR